MENFELEISDLGMNGEGIGHFENLTCFVPYALKDEKIESILNQEKSPKELVSNLMEEALKSTKDNTTIMVFEIKKDSKKNNYLPLIIIPVILVKKD